MRFTLLLSLLFVSSLEAEVTYLGMGTLPGDGTDLSGLTEKLEDGSPHNRLGGMGSAIAYTGKGNRYLLVSDRGPKDGAVEFACRFHAMDIVVNPKQSPVVSIKLTATHLLTNEKGERLVGSSHSLDLKHPAKSLRFDAEGVRIGPTGTLFISDEYGPFVREFSPKGKMIRDLPVPAKFQPQHPAKKAEDELPPKNLSGRLPNRGFEGLAISPDGKKLLAALQGPLLQDGALDEEKKRIGLFNRFLEIDIASGRTREFVYALEDPGHGVNEILAEDSGTFLVIERDGKPGAETQCKKLFRIDLTGATDVSKIDSLPSTKLPQSIVAVKKTLFLDMMDPKFKIDVKDIPEKLEGLTFGPPLPDGRTLLLITSDNDFIAEQPIRVFAFAIG